MNEDTSTIAALSTAPAPAGIAVIRISGPKTRKALNAIFHSTTPPTQNPRQLVYGDLTDYKTGETIDKAMAVFMPGPASYTGEDVGEIQLHGSLLLVQKVLKSLYAYGVTPAEPGEFTKRAFLNNKLDLVQAEAIGDIITATTEAALRAASQQMEGRLSAAIDLIGEPLRDALAEVEAQLDFPEEDLGEESSKKAKDVLSRCIAEINKLSSSYQCGRIIREGYKVLLAGRPNSGKSSLLNLLLGAERVIVTDIPGTTRDLIEEELLLDGYRFVFCDSAGMTSSEDVVEKIGVELSYEKIGWADLVFFVADVSEGIDDDAESWMVVLQDVRKRAKKLWLILNKIDLVDDAISRFAYESRSADQVFYLSAKTGDGVDVLKDALKDEVSSMVCF
ncbi:MAG: tRNA uridine-5-carboxymethylaminomethyl(34) synthesis GTPase MnmE, partial [Candidatus Dadabacteria bacterium]